MQQNSLKSTGQEIIYNMQSNNVLLIPITLSYLTLILVSTLQVIHPTIIIISLLILVSIMLLTLIFNTLVLHLLRDPYFSITTHNITLRNRETDRWDCENDCMFSIHMPRKCLLNLFLPLNRSSRVESAV